MNPPPKATLDARIEIAREEVYITRSALDEVDARLAELEQHGDPEGVQEDYLQYRDRLRLLYKEQVNALDELQDLLQAHYPQASQTNRVEIPSDWNLPQMDAAENVSSNHAEKAWQDALAEYDLFLETEYRAASETLQAIQARHHKAIDARQKEVDEAATRLVDQGIDIKQPPSPNQREETDSSTVQDEEPSPASTEPSSSPHRDPTTDDATATVIREAAEAETDPEKKKRLWEEYDAYKETM